MAAKLTGYGIDIKSESDIEEAIDNSEESNVEDIELDEAFSFTEQE